MGAVFSPLKFNVKRSPETNRHSSQGQSEHLCLTRLASKHLSFEF